MAYVYKTNPHSPNGVGQLIVGAFGAALIMAAPYSRASRLVDLPNLVGLVHDPHCDAPRALLVSI